MEGTRLARTSISELKKRIILAQERKLKLIQYLQELWEKFRTGKISRDFYVETAHRHFDGKTLKEWVEYYQHYIGECERLIKKHKKNIALGRLGVFVFSLILVIFLLGIGLYTQPQFVGLIVQEPTLVPEVVTDTEVTITTTQQQAILGQPVKWTKTISLDNPTTTKIRLPKEAENIFVNKISYSEENLEEVLQNQTSSFQEEPLPSSETEKQEAIFSITGLVTAEDVSGVQEPLISRFFRNFGRITGQAILGPEEKLEIEIDDTATEYEIEYETEAPYAVEELIERGKRVKIIGPETIHYENVLSFTNLDESLNIKNPRNVKIFWREENKFISPTSVQDTDNNGIYDYIEWIAPILSTQTFDIIVITKAEHLDSNRNFISDIFNEVRELDDVWSETIPDQDYVRVVFESNLRSTNDITIYPRIISGNPKIEVYEFQGTEIIAEFTSIDSNEYNKIFLTNLVGEQDTFDLRIAGGSVEFGHIIDPQAEPGGATELRAQACFSQTKAPQYDYFTACDSTYPSASCSGSADFLSCNDGNSETTTYNANTYAGYNATYQNTAISNCEAVTEVFLCWEWWISATDPTAAGIEVDANDGVSFTSINTTLPGNSANPGLFCQNVTASETWTCGNFFSGGNAARARNFVTRTSGGGPDTLTQDALFFNVTYTESAGDTEAPKWQFPSVNDTTPLPNRAVRHNVNWTDDTALNYATLEVNGTGASCNTAANVSDTTLSGLSAWANLTWLVPNACEGQAIGWKQYANDTANNWNITDTQVYVVQNVNPTTLFGTNPVDVENTSSNSVTFEFKTSDNLNVDALRLYGNWTGTWSINQTNMTAVNDSYWNITVTGIPDGKNHVWAAWGNDTLGNFDFTDTNRTFTVDTTPPSISNPFSNETDILQNEIFCLNITATDTIMGVDVVLAEVNDTTALVNYTMTDTGSTTCDGSSDDDVYGVEIQATNAGIWNYTRVFANDTVGNSDILDFTDISINVTSSNAAPTIDIVETILSKNPTDDTTTTIVFNFTATDTDGASDINLNSAQGFFQRTGEATRSNLSCSDWASAGNDVNFTCTIDMQYFDENGAWDINVTVRDNSQVTAENSSTQFTYNLLKGMKISPTALTWPAINLPDTNIEANENITINNTGNDINLNINVTALDLQGEITSTQFIFAENFTVESAPGTCSGNAMINNTQVNITSAILQRGNHTLNFGNATSGQEQILFCLEGVPQDITSQPYSSSGLGAWTVRILLVAIIPASKKKKKKKERENKLIDVLDLSEYIGLVDKLKGEVFSKEEIVKTIIKKLSMKYNIDREELLRIIKAREGITIPIGIFSKKLGALESLAKYMKENLDMNYREIAKELGRDERTIWTAYKKANEKQKEPIKPKETKINMPTSVLENKKLTILESVIIYLKQKGFKFSEIEKLLERDQRNIGTIYSRAMKKIKHKK